MDIPSLHEVNQWLDSGGKMQYQTVSCSVCNAEFPVEATASHSCASYLKAAIDELGTTVRELERKYAEMEDRLQMYESDGR